VGFLLLHDDETTGAWIALALFFIAVGMCYADSRRRNMKTTRAWLCVFMIVNKKTPADQGAGVKRDTGSAAVG
jgi:hypothetical protein